jgi:hypothetical protein
VDHQEDRRGDFPERAPIGGYEPPRVERVLAPSELELEILYAGAAGSPDA